jgi:phospho-N-acetylmuramoyl-pentapeptide-transferase
MLYWIFVPLEPWFQGFNLFRYISFRAAFAAVLSFLVVIVCAPGLVAWLRSKRLHGCADHDSKTLERKREGKQGIPTMGGIVILLAVGVATLLLGRLDNLYVLVTLLAFLAFGALGALDDWAKLRRTGAPGMSAKGKLLGQGAIAAAALLVWYLHAGPGGESLVRAPRLEPSPYRAETLAAEVASVPPAAERIPTTGVTVPLADHRTDLQVPFFKHFCLDLGILFLLFGALVVVGSSNAVNLTDGLDGLATGCVAVAALTFALVAYLVGRADTADYLFVFHIPGAGELGVLCAALAGAALGFLWFNGYPASVFMGDTGSLALGGALGLVAVATRHELTLFLAGGVFVAEALSVIAQRRWYKATGGSRIFLCAPLHHHYEFQGLHEAKVTVRFWIVAIVLALLSLALLKLR